MRVFQKILFAAIALCGVTWVYSELPDKHPLDETEYERIVLDNGLRVLLVSDPKLDKASASMAIGVGSLSDPAERQGLAHFLEHMLFLGTEKYPDAAEYGNYLQSNGGYSNAYTSGDHTNYHFEVYPFAFEGALDRFAQFFIAPLFSQEFTDREKQAVNSEHQKNLENDRWRGYQLWRMHYNPEHPANHFSTGNDETLEGIESEEFINFYKKYYSANQMALSLVSPNSIAEMKAWVETYFSDVQNQGKERVKFPSDYILPSESFRLIKVIPVKDLRTLSIEIPMPVIIDQFESKTESLIGYIIGFEGKGSLLSALKTKGLATGLGASINADTLDYGSLNISIELTPLGLERYKEIIGDVFSYVKLMKDSPYPRELFEERKTMARLEELYSNKGDGSQRAVALANRVLNYPLEVAERVPYLWGEPNEETYFDLLNHVVPEMMMVQLVAKGLETDQVEPIYGSSFAYVEEEGAFFESLKTPKDATGMTMPEANPFVPKEVKLLSERPIEIINEKGLELHYSQDQEFQRPKVAIQFKIRHPESFVTLENTVLKDFYADCVREGLNELAYPARTAGLSYSIAAGTEGLYLTLNGYNESALILLDEVVKEMLNMTISQERFDALKDGKIRELENFPKGDAWRISREAKSEIQTKVFYSSEQRLQVAKDVTLEDVTKFIKTLYRKGRIEALVHGNVTKETAVAAARKIQSELGMKAVSKDKVFENSILDLPQGEVAVRELKLEVSNSSLWSEYIIGEDEPEIRAASLILGNYISEPFYTEMRTKQQLGYITSAFTSRDDWQYGIYLVIQSGEYPADVLRSRTEEFLATMPAMFEALAPEDFDRLKEAAIAQVEEKAKSISEKAGRYFSMIYNLDSDFDRNADSVKALQSITQEQVASIFARSLSPDQAVRRFVLAYGREHEVTSDLEMEAIEDVDAWKSNHSYR